MSVYFNISFIQSFLRKSFYSLKKLFFLTRKLYFYINKYIILI